MDATKSTKCRIGWHHWDFTTEGRQVVRTCTACGKRRYRGAGRADRGDHSGGAWAAGMGASGGGFFGGDSGFGGDGGGGCGGDGGGSC